QNIAAEAKEIFTAALARPMQIDGNSAFNPPRPWAHNHNAVAHVNCFVDVVCNQEHRGAASLPEAKHFILHPHARKSVQRAERFVQEKDFGMIDKRSRERGTLGHAAGKMVGIGVGKYFKAHQTHELIYFLVFFSQNPTRDQPGFNVATDGEPREEIRILKNQTAFRSWMGDRVRADQKFSRVGRIQTGNEAKERGLPAATWADERN